MFPDMLLHATDNPKLGRDAVDEDDLSRCQTFAGIL